MGSGNQKRELSHPMARVVVQSLSPVRLSVTPWTAVHQTPLSFPVSQSLLRLMSIEPVIPSNHLILCHPLLLPPSIFPSIRGFSSESVLGIRWPKYWSFSFKISPSNEYSGLIAFRIDWFDLFTVQGTLKSPSITVIMIVMLCSSEWFYVLHQLSLDFLKDLCSSFIF